jgi:hypothetical protein
LAVTVALERAVGVAVAVAKVVTVAVAIEWCSSGSYVVVAVMWQWRLSDSGC